MISGAHIVVYSTDAEADRAFFRDVLRFASVDAGHGWLIFALPAAEAAFHPSDENDQHELFFMCKDLKAEMAALAEKGVHCSDVQEAPGARSRRFGCRAEARSAFTNRSTRPRWASADAS